MQAEEGSLQDTLRPSGNPDRQGVGSICVSQRGGYSPLGGGEEMDAFGNVILHGGDATGDAATVCCHHHHLGTL